MIGFLKKLFGGGSEPAIAKPSAAKISGGGTGNEAFVNFVVQSLVDNPAAVKVTTAMSDDGRDQTVRIACEKKDIGKIIGKSGKTIAAIRTLVNGAAGRTGQRVNVEVLD